MEQTIRDLIAKGEKVDVEFKSAQGGLPKNLYETVCAFSNTIGGYIILGVNDNKEIIGINPSDINKLKKEFTISCNNEQIVNPTIFTELKEIKIDDKIILYAYIEKSKTIQKTKNKVFIRNHEGDFNITDNLDLILRIYNQKYKIYDEDKVYPDIDIEKDLNHDLIEKARKLADVNVGYKKTHRLI